jgi:hypothetical protein
MEILLKNWTARSLCSGVQFRPQLALVKSRQQSVELAQRPLAHERLPSHREKRTASWIGHPGGQALPILRGLYKQLTFSPFRVALNGAHLLTVQRVEGVLDLDGAQIAGIIRRRR